MTVSSSVVEFLVSFRRVDEFPGRVGPREPGRVRKGETGGEDERGNEWLTSVGPENERKLIRLYTQGWSPGNVDTNEDGLREKG